MRRKVAVAPALVLVVAAIACNSIVGFDDLQTANEDGTSSSSSGSSGNSGSSSSGSVDVVPEDTGAPEAPRCDRTKPFNAPAIVPELDGTVVTKSAIMTPDERRMFYLRGQAKPLDLRRATRKSRSDPWSEPTTELLSIDASQLLSLAVGGLKLYYWRVAETLDTKPRNLVAPRKAKLDPWQPSNELLVPDTFKRATYVTSSDEAAYWAESVVTDGGGLDGILRRGIVKATGVDYGPAVPGLHDGVVRVLDDSPVLNSTETTIYFSSSGRPGGISAADIYTSTRPTKNDPWSKPVLVRELSSDAADFPTWVSDDDCVLLLDRSGHWLQATRPL